MSSLFPRLALTHDRSQQPSAPYVSLVHPLTVSVGTAVGILAIGGAWYRYGRRLRTVEDLRRIDFSPRRLRGTVVRISDADGLRVHHRPLLQPFRRLPKTRSELAQTLSIRLAGVDAPELAHFGKKEQPFAKDAVKFLTRTVLNRRVTLELYQKDRYGRAVGHVYVRSFPFFRRRSVSELLVEAGYATVYTQAGAAYGGRYGQLRALEAEARSKKRGMWIQGRSYESPGDYKRRMRAENNEESVL